MRRFRRRTLVLCTLVLLVLGITVAGWSVNAAVRYNAKDLAGPPPSSLDQYFQPAAPPVYLIEMFGLAGPFEAIGIHLQENDFSYVKPSFDAFKTQYDKVSKMVPEWTKSFPQSPVEDLGRAIDSGDPVKIGRAMGAVGQVCSDCHLVYQVKVQQKYHWREFDTVTLKDPTTTGDNVTFGEYMTAMAVNFEGAIADLSDNLTTKAQNNFTEFRDEFQALADNACKQCHTDPMTGQPIPRNYYVDANSMALVAAMGSAVDTDNLTAVTNLSGAIGNSICFNCHLVHMPAQNAKDIWTQFDKILK